jgi:enterochelin esterase family protein
MPRHVIVITFLLCAAPTNAQGPLGVNELRVVLADPPTGPAAERLGGLAERIRNWFGKANLPKGPAPKVEELTAAWAIEVEKPEAVVRVVSLDGKVAIPLRRIGTSTVHAVVKDFPDGTAFRWRFEVDGKQLLPITNNADQFEVYRTPAEAKEQPGVPRGRLTQKPKWESKVFTGTTRDWWVYVPAQYKSEKPACVMVFQDGGGYKDFVPLVFDNLIHKGEMPVTVGVFINPGTFKEGNRSNRSFEYDTLSDQYARLLLEEMLPEVEKEVKLRHDPASRAIAGISSGGICAWTVAWERPGEFGKVLSWVGSFTNIASGKSLRDGGHNYPALIRKTEKKPIRVFLQAGANDLDNIHGSWPLANLTMEKALAFKGYDYQFVYGQGFHSNRHGRAILPDSLRWLWRDHEAPPKPGPQGAGLGETSRAPGYAERQECELRPDL